MNIRLFGMKIRVEMAIAFLVLGMILGGSLLCNCTGTLMEGMAPLSGSNNEHSNQGVEDANEYARSNDEQNNLNNHESYNGTPSPLKDGQMFFWEGTEFKPECCGSNYTSSTGCACATEEQVKFINTRGGNRTENSQF